MKRGLTEEDAAFLMTKEQLAKGSTALPPTAAVLSGINNSNMH